MVHNLLVLLQDLVVDRLVKDINLGARKLARADALLEQHVELRKGPAARLGDAEVCVNDAEEADAALKFVSSCLAKVVGDNG